MASRFLFNETLWEELGDRIAEAKTTRAAVAYLGSGASRLLPLKNRDKLVVEMSLRALRCGTTDPREIQKLLRKGVAVFSRGSLHAKFFLVDRILIAGSSNISKHARDGLDEAAVMTNDPASVRRAATTFDMLCNEPVRKDYLKKCIHEYRPPKFGPGQRDSGKRNKVTAAKLWIIGGLRYRELPHDEEGAAGRIVKKAEKRLLDFERSDVDYSHYPSRLGFFRRLREGDWLIVCVGDGKGFDVSPPARFLGLDHYARGKGKRRYLLLYECPTDAKTIRWSKFRSVAPTAISAARGTKPRTVPITRDEDADSLLRLWDSRGRLRGRKA